MNSEARGRGGGKGKRVAEMGETLGQKKGEGFGQLPKISTTNSPHLLFLCHTHFFHFPAPFSLPSPCPYPSTFLPQPSQIMPLLFISHSHLSPFYLWPLPIHLSTNLLHLSPPITCLAFSCYPPLFQLSSPHSHYNQSEGGSQHKTSPIQFLQGCGLAC